MSAQPDNVVKVSIAEFLGLNTDKLERNFEYASVSGQQVIVSPEVARRVHHRLCRLKTLEKFLREGDLRSAQALVAESHDD